MCNIARDFTQLTLTLIVKLFIWLLCELANNLLLFLFVAAVIYMAGNMAGRKLWNNSFSSCAAGDFYWDTFLLVCTHSQLMLVELKTRHCRLHLKSASCHMQQSGLRLCIFVCVWSRLYGNIKCVDMHKCGTQCQEQGCLSTTYDDSDTKMMMISRIMMLVMMKIYQLFENC